MGYEATIKINGELDQKYKTYVTQINKSNNHMYKTLLIGTCLQHYDNLDCHKRKCLYEEIAMFVRLYVTTISDEWKLTLKKTLEENDNEFYVCGWDFAKNSSDETNIENIEEYVIEQLFLYATCANVEMISDEGKWHDKKTCVLDIVNDIEDSVWSFWDHEFYNDYKEKEGTTFEESY